AGASVRLGDKTHALQLGHFGADGGAAHAKNLSQKLRTDGAGDLGVLLHNSVQDLLLAICHINFNSKMLALQCQECQRDCRWGAGCPSCGMTVFCWHSWIQPSAPKEVSSSPLSASREY